MQPHEHLNNALNMVQAAMAKPKPDVSAGVAERELGVTGKSDPFEELRLIAANRSADPVLANVEDAVRNALARHDARKHRDDPACDRFTIDRYSDSIVDVNGSNVAVGTYHDMVNMVFVVSGSWSDLVAIPRSTAIELRDALDMLIRATGEDGDE